MTLVHLALSVEGEGFDALSSGLRNRITENSIFIQTDELIEPKTQVVVEVQDCNGRTELRGDGSVADVQTTGDIGVLIAVQWEAKSRSIVDKILVETSPSIALDESWAEALSGGTPSLPPPETLVEPVPESEPEPEFVPLNLSIDLPPLTEDGIAISDDLDEEEPSQRRLLPEDPSPAVAPEDEIVISEDLDEEVPNELLPEDVLPPVLSSWDPPALEATQSLPELEYSEESDASPASGPVVSLPPPITSEQVVPASPVVSPSPSPPRSEVPRPPMPAKLQRPRPSGPRTGVVIGIDLGTTFSCAAICENGEARLLPTRQGRPVIPSAVYYDPSGRIFVGDVALRQGEVDPQRTVVGSKRLMGRAFHAPIVQEVKDHFAYDVVQGPSGESAVRMGDRVFALEEVAAEILRELKESATQQVKGRVERAVVTCPAYFNERQREAVRVAGEIAGLHVERVLNEPTAAAIHYGYDRPSEGRRLLVYDLGGGTFDVSLLQVHQGVYEVLATGGDSFLGGIDFDACLAEMLASALIEQEGIDPRTDRSAVARLLKYAEAAKRELSSTKRTVVQIDHLVVHPYAARSLTVPLDQTKAEAAFSPLVDKTLSVVADLFKRAGLQFGDISDVLLVGGQTRTPLIRRQVGALFRRNPVGSVHPDYAVALGAAKYAATLDRGGIDLVDTLPMSIGVGLPGGRFKKVIARDTRLPARRKYRLRTTRDNQRSFEILIFQGEDDAVIRNEPLGMLHVPKLKKAPRGSISLDVEFEISDECLLKLRATEPKSKNVVDAEFGTKDTPDGLRRRLGLPDQPTHDELNRMRNEVNRPKGVWGWLTGLFGRSGA